MATPVVQAVEPKWSTARAGASATSKTFDIEYQVTFDIVHVENPIHARVAAGVPRVGEGLSSDPWLRVTRVGDVRMDGGTLAIVPVHYETSTGGGDQEANPLDDPADIEWFHITTVEPIEEDGDGNPIVNTVNERLDPPMEVEIDDPAIRISRNVLTSNRALAASYMRAVNSDAFTVDGHNIAIGEAKLVRWDAVKVRDETDELFDFYQETIEVAFREDGWKRRRLNQGYREQTGVDADGKPTYKNITDENGQRVTEPVLLAADGTILADGADAVYLEIPPRKKLPFATIGLPT